MIFIASLAVRSAELLCPASSLSRRGAGWKLLGGLIVSHTIHFAFVGMLTIRTQGRNILDRGGWTLAVVVGILFYAATVGGLVLRRASSSARTIRNLAADAVLSILVGLAFLQPYLARAHGSALFAVMAALLAGTMLAFAAASAARIIRPRLL